MLDDDLQRRSPPPPASVRVVDTRPAPRADNQPPAGEARGMIRTGENYDQNSIGGSVRSHRARRVAPRHACRGTGLRAAPRNSPFSTSCNPTAQARFNRGMRYQHSFWYDRPRRCSRTSLKADPECAIAYWGIALSLLWNPHVPPPAANLPLGLAALQKAQGARRRDAARARLHRRARRVLHRLRQGRPSHPRAGLSQGDGGAGAALSGRRRGADRLRASRSTSRPRRPTRPMPTSSRAPRSWSRSSSASRIIRASPTT